MVLGAEGAIGLLRLVVFEKGADYVYPQRIRDNGTMICTNFLNGQPSCIVGHVLANLGMTAEKAQELKVAYDISITDVANHINESDFPWEISNDAVDVLHAAQSRQDAGWCWGHALEHAEKVFGVVTGQ